MNPPREVEKWIIRHFGLGLTQEYNVPLLRVFRRGPQEKVSCTRDEAESSCQEAIMKCGFTLYVVEQLICFREKS
jgi:hypothetical protein